MKTLKDVQEELTNANLALNTAMRHVVNVTAFLAQLEKHTEETRGNESIRLEGSLAPVEPAPVAKIDPAQVTLRQRMTEATAAMSTTIEALRAKGAPTPTAQPKAAAPTPATPTPATPTPVQREEKVDPRPAQEFLQRSLHDPVGLFSQFFSADVHPFGSGLIGPGDHWVQHENNVSVEPREVIATWPTGFYYNEMGEPIFFINREGHFYGWTTIGKNGTTDFSFYSRDHEDPNLYHASKVTDLTDAKRLFTRLKNLFTEELTR